MFLDKVYTWAKEAEPQHFQILQQAATACSAEGPRSEQMNGYQECVEDVDRTPTHNTHLCSTVCSQARSAHHALGSREQPKHDLHFIFVRLKRICHLVLHVSYPWLSHLPYTTSTSSSSFTLPSTTQEHAAHSVQEQLREHPVHHAHLQAPSVDKLRHQESLWREPAEWRKLAHTKSHRL